MGEHQEQLSRVTYESPTNQAVVELVATYGRRVLDVGCGTGENARLLTEFGCSVVGVTLSQVEADRASRWCHEVLVCDVQEDDIPLPAASFDVVLLSHVLEHVPGPAEVLTRLARFLAPGGRCVVAVPNMASWQVRLLMARGDWRRSDFGFLDKTHVHFWSLLTARELFTGSPFVICALTPSDYRVPLWLLRRALPRVGTRVDQLVGPLFPNLFAQQVIAVAELPSR